MRSTNWVWRQSMCYCAKGKMASVGSSSVNLVKKRVQKVLYDNLLVLKWMNATYQSKIWKICPCAGNVTNKFEWGMNLLLHLHEHNSKGYVQAAKLVHKGEPSTSLRQPTLLETVQKGCMTQSPLKPGIWIVLLDILWPKTSSPYTQ